MKKVKHLEPNNNKPTVAYSSTPIVSVSSSSPIPSTPISSPLSPLTASTAPTLTTETQPVLLPSPMGEEADKFVETLMRQQKEIADWFENYIKEG